MKTLKKIILGAMVITSPIWGYNCNKANNEISDVVKTEKNSLDVIYQELTEKNISDNKNYIIMNDNLKAGNSDKVYELLKKYLSHSLQAMKKKYELINKYNVSEEFKETLEKQIETAEDYLNK